MLPPFPKGGADCGESGIDKSSYYAYLTTDQARSLSQISAEICLNLQTPWWRLSKSKVKTDRGYLYYSESHFSDTHSLTFMRYEQYVFDFAILFLNTAVFCFHTASFFKKSRFLCLTTESEIDKM